MRNTQNLKKSSSWFDKSADLLSKRQNHEEDFSQKVRSLTPFSLKNPDRIMT
jgi:hypothetical protein